MNQKLQNIFDLIQQSETLNIEQKDILLEAVKDADKELEITAFKLERTEKVKKTTAILLEETIAELEQKRRAVEAQNRELEIESALEKVRTIAMGMRIPADMLNICKTISLQLQSIGIKEIRNVQTAIFYEQRGTYMNYEFYARHDKTIITETSFTNHEMHNEFAKKMLSGKGEVFITHIIGDEVKDWIAYQKTTNVFIDKYLETASSINYYWFSLGPVALGISTYHPLTEEEIDLFKRFLKVFELAYQRYLDIEKAEGQAKEAQIQLSLERVRARTMAMHKSDELAETSTLIFEQFQTLGILPKRCGFVIQKDDESIEIWGAVKNDNVYKSYKLGTIHSKAHPIFTLGMEEWRKGSPDFAYVLKGSSLKDYYKTISVSTNMPENIAAKIIKKTVVEYHYNAFFKHGSITTIFQENPDEANRAVIRRFAKVLEQTYTRFLDLQKAEAQAREAQIEAALERVRSRTMAMHKSEELKEVIKVVLEQFIHLNINAEHAGFYIDYKASDDMHIWLADPNIEPFYASFPYFDTPTWNSFLDAKAKGKNFFTDLLDFEEKNKFYRSLFKFFEVPEDARKFYLECKGLAVSTVLLDTVGLYIENFSAVPYTDEENKILMRFGTVFQQTYTRFLDLQRAEAQARESQIEAALERIRSRSLAMQKSEELAETAAVLFQQLHELGYVPDRITIGIIKEDIRSIELWSTDQVGNKITHIFKPSIEETTTWSKIYNQWKAKAKSLVIDLSGIELNEWIRYVREEMHMFINEEVLKENRRVHSVSFFSHGFIMMSTIEAMPVEKIDVLERFSLVFNQTYTRFLDLKKAEYQAREAQIEVALERVRSKTLAMHTSEELAKTSSVVFKQLINLGIEPNRIYIAIIKNDKGDAEFWITNEDGSKVNSGFEVNLNDNSSFKKIFEGWKEHKKSMTIDMQGEELKEYFNHLTRLGVQFNEGLSQKRRMQYVGYFSKGFIGIASPDETKPETLLLLERFAAVFNLTYTRFNDLLQAEEQNRIIQAENERKTKELEDARRLQISMLPKELPRLPRLDIAVYMKTTTEVGGDYYDFSIDNNGTLTFIVGDATGHGLMSGMMVSIMKSFFISNRNHISLKDFFENANNSIKDMKLGRLMMALMGVQITSDEIIATSAGMPPLIYFRNKSGKAGEFVINNLPLGGMKGIKYSLKKIKYEKGDVLLMMSDGFAESKNNNGEQFGYEKVKKEFKSVIQKKSNEIVKHLTDLSFKWIDGKEPEDDITFVVIKIK